MTVGAGATGGRAWLAARSPDWMTPRRLKQATAAILAAGVLASGMHMAPNGTTGTAKAAAPPATATTR